MPDNAGISAFTGAKAQIDVTDQGTSVIFTGRIGIGHLIRNRQGKLHVVGDPVIGRSVKGRDGILHQPCSVSGGFRGEGVCRKIVIPADHTQEVIRFRSLIALRRISVASGVS